MTARERFLRVLAGEMPDRVPVTLFIVDQGHFLNQMYPDVDPWDFEALQLKVIELQRQLGVDVFVRVLFGLNDPLSIHMGGLNRLAPERKLGSPHRRDSPRKHDHLAVDDPHARRNAHPGFFPQRDPPRHVPLCLHEKADQDSGRSGDCHPL